MGQRSRIFCNEARRHFVIGNCIAFFSFLSGERNVSPLRIRKRRTLLTHPAKILLAWPAEGMEGEIFPDLFQPRLNREREISIWWCDTIKMSSFLPFPFFFPFKMADFSDFLFDGRRGFSRGKSQKCEIDPALFLIPFISWPEFYLGNWI